jgi:hypothetical protein
MTPLAWLPSYASITFMAKSSWNRLFENPESLEEPDQDRGAKRISDTARLVLRVQILHPCTPCVSGS